jgi:uncharacterized membrane protein
MGVMLQNGGVTDLTSIIVIIIALLILWILLKQMGRQKKRRSFRSTSLGHLRQRYARGDISDEEYEKQKKEFEKE